MAMTLKLALASLLIGSVASADPGFPETETDTTGTAAVERDAQTDLRPPGQTMASEPTRVVVVHPIVRDKLATTERWG